MAYQTAVHDSTKFTPERLMMGYEIRAPIDLMHERPESERIESSSSFVEKLHENLSVIHKFAKKNLELKYERMEKNYNIDSTERAFFQGDLVWFYNPRREKGMFCWSWF